MALRSRSTAGSEGRKLVVGRHHALCSGPTLARMLGPRCGAYATSGHRVIPVSCLVVPCPATKAVPYLAIATERGFRSSGTTTRVSVVPRPAHLEFGDP